MRTDAPEQEGVHRFQVPAVLETIEYRDMPVVPDKINPHRISALARGISEAGIEDRLEEFDAWLGDAIEEWPVVFAIDETVRKHGTSYKVGRNFAVQVFADSNPDAHEIVKQCFDAGPFISYTIQPFQADTQSGQKAIEAFDRVIEKYGREDVVGYEPEYPELHIGNLEPGTGPERGETVGIIRFDMGRERITDIIDDGRKYLQNPETGSDDFQLRIGIRDKGVSDRIVEAANRMLTEGEVFETITLAEDNDPAVSLVIGMDDEDVHRLFNFVDTIPDPIYDEMGMTYWPHDFSEYMTDMLIDSLERALEADEPGVINKEKKKTTTSESDDHESEPEWASLGGQDSHQQPPVRREMAAYRISVELDAADAVYDHLDASYVDDLPIDSLGESDDGLVIVEPEVALFIDARIDTATTEEFREALGAIDVSDHSAKINVFKAQIRPTDAQRRLCIEAIPEFNVPALRDEVRQAVTSVNGTIEEENIPSVARYETASPYFIMHDVPTSMTPDRELEDEQKRAEKKEKMADENADLQTTVNVKRVTMTELDMEPEMVEF